MNGLKERGRFRTLDMEAWGFLYCLPCIGCHSISGTPCQLHCKPENKFFSVMMKDIVADGTRCLAGTRNMCISGRCRV